MWSFGNQEIWDWRYSHTSCFSVPSEMYYFLERLTSHYPYTDAHLKSLCTRPNVMCLCAQLLIRKFVSVDILTELASLFHFLNQQNVVYSGVVDFSHDPIFWCSFDWSMPGAMYSTVGGIFSTTLISCHVPPRVSFPMYAGSVMACYWYCNGWILWSYRLQNGVSMSNEICTLCCVSSDSVQSSSSVYRSNAISDAVRESFEYINVCVHTLILFN